MIKKYRILFVVFDEIDPFAGGVQNIVSVLSQIFIEHGHSVKFLLLNHAEKSNIDYFQINETDLNSKQINQRLLDYLNHNKFDFVINNHGINYYNFFNEFKKYNIYLDTKFKLINYHHNAIKDIFINYENITLNKFNNSNSRFSKLIALLFNRIAILRFLYLILGKIKLWYSFIKGIQYGDANVFYFESFKEESQKLFLAKRQVLYENILPPIKYSFSHPMNQDKENIILFVGRVELMQKRFDRVLSIWKDCYKDLKDWKLVVVGEGDYLENAKQYVCKNDLMNIAFIGKADPKEYFVKSKIFILTSDFEGLGLVLVEALTQGCVPISFDCYSGIHNVIINGFNGVIVPKNDESEFKKNILELANNHQMLVELQKNNRSIEDDFSKVNILFQWNKLFVKLTHE